MPRTVWILRHGNRHDFVEPEWLLNSAQFLNPSLSIDGFQQGKEVGEFLKKEEIHHIFTSPFLRTVQTANCVAESLDLPLKLEWGLSEFLSFSWLQITPELIPPPVLAQEFPRIDLTYQSSIEAPYPESYNGAKKRVQNTITRLTQGFTGNLLFVTHKGAIAYMAQQLTQQSIKSIKVYYPVCSLVKLEQEKNQNWQLKLNGHIAHLSQTSASRSFLEKVSRKVILAQRLLLPRH